MKSQQNGQGHIFISFTGADKDVVVPIINRLRRHHFVVWTYLENLGGVRYPELIEEKIKTCSVFIVIESPKAVNSKDVRQEVQLAHKHNRNLVPVVIDPAAKDAFEYQTAGIVRISLHQGRNDANFSQLVESIKAYKPQRRPGRPKAPENPVENLAWLRPHLVNRTIQEFALTNFCHAILTGRIASPGFFLLHGREEECGDVFIQRVAHHIVPNAFKEGSRRGYVHPDQISWPDHRDDMENNNEAANARYDVLLDSAQGALTRARLRAASGTVFMLQLPIEDWRGEDLILLRKFLLWWQTPHDGFPDRSPLVVIAYVAYGNGILGARWRRWTLRPTHRMLGPQKARLSQVDPRPTAALPPLARISKIDAINWIHRHQPSLTTPDPAIAAQAIARHFRRPLGLGDRRIPMKRAVDALGALLRDGALALGEAK